MHHNIQSRKNAFTLNSFNSRRGNFFSNFLWSFWLVRFCTGLAPDLSRQSCSRRALSVQSMKLWLANFAFLCFLLFVLQCSNGHLHETALFIQNSNNLPFESFWYLGEDNGTGRLILTTRKSLRPGLRLYGSTIWSHCAARCSHIKSWHLLQHQLMAEKLCSKAEEAGYRNGQVSDARKHPNVKTGYEWFHGRIVPEYRFRHLRNVVHPCCTEVGKKVDHDLQYACTWQIQENCGQQPTELTKEASTQLYQCPHNAHTLPTLDCTKACQSMSDPTKPASWKIAQQRLAKHWSALSSCPCLFDEYRSDQANMMATSGPREVRVRRSGRLRRWPLENRPNRERAAYFRPSQSLPWIPPARQLQRTMRWRSMRLRNCKLKYLVTTFDKMYQKKWKCIKMWQNVKKTKCIKIWKNGSKCEKTYQNVSRWNKLYQNVTKCTKHVTKCDKSVTKCDNMYQNKWKCIKMWQKNEKCQHVSKCDKMDQNVTKCIKIHENVTSCDKMYQNVSACIKMWQ